MKKIFEKLFGGITLTWPGLIIFAILKNKKSRLITGAITIIAAVIYVILAFNVNAPYEIYNNTIFEENNIELIGEPVVTYWAGSDKGGVEVIYWRTFFCSCSR